MAHEQYESCIAACNRSAEASNHCAVSCLFESNRHELARCIQLDMDCAEICRLAAGYMARGSELVMEMCAFCADVCEACAEECERHPMQHCRKCAEACRACVRECRRMAGANRSMSQSQGSGRHSH
jgi:hypothetical protein